MRDDSAWCLWLHVGEGAKLPVGHYRTSRKKYTMRPTRKTSIDEGRMLGRGSRVDSRRPATRTRSTSPLRISSERRGDAHTSSSYWRRPGNRRPGATPLLE